MTYSELKAAVGELTNEQLNCDVIVVNVHGDETFY